MSHFICMPTGDSIIGLSQNGSLLEIPNNRNDKLCKKTEQVFSSLLVMAMRQNNPAQLEALLKHKISWSVKPIMLLTRNLELLRILFHHCDIGQRVEEIVIENYGYRKVRELVLNNELNPFEKLFPDESEEETTKRVFNAIGRSLDSPLLIWFEETFERIRQGMQDDAIKSHFLLTILKTPKLTNKFDFFYLVLKKMGRLSLDTPQLAEIKDAAFQEGPNYIALIYSLLTPEPISALLNKAALDGFQSLHEDDLKKLNSFQDLPLIQAEIEFEIMRREVGRSELDPENLPASLIKVMHSNPGHLRILSYEQLQAVLIYACREGNQAITSRMLKLYETSLIKTEVNHFGMRGTLLTLAAASGNAGLISQLVQAGLSLDRDPQILHIAVIHKKIKLIQWLRKQSIFLTDRESFENSLIAAEKSGSLKMIEELLLFNVKLYQTRAEIVISRLRAKTVKGLISNNKIDPFEALEDESFTNTQIRLFSSLGRSLDFDLLKWFQNHYKQVRDGMQDEVLISALLSGALEFYRENFLADRDEKEMKYRFCVQLVRSFRPGQFTNLCTELEPKLNTSDIWLPALFYSLDAEEPIKSILNKIVDHRSVQCLEVHELEALQNYTRNKRMATHLEKAVQNALESNANPD